MSDTENTVPRTAADVIADLDVLVTAAHVQAIPFSLTRAIELLVEHAKLSPVSVAEAAVASQTVADVLTLSTRVDGIDKLLTEAGIATAPAPAAAPAPAPAVDGSTNPAL